MIVGTLVSADGGQRRKNLRKTHIISETERLEIVKFIDDYVIQNVPDNTWFSGSSLFPAIPTSITGTPLVKLYNICHSKSSMTERQQIIEFKKHLGMILREALSLSSFNYYEQFDGSTKVYKRTTNIDIT